MKHILKTILVSMLVLLCLGAVCYAADAEGILIDNANAEGDTPLHGYNIVGSGVEKFEVVKDPLNPENNVYYLDANVVDKKSWTYVWFKDLKFTPGMSYKITYDVLIDKSAAGDVVSAANSCACFEFADTAMDEGKVKHHGTSGAGASNSKWTTVSVTYTIPETLDETKAMNFGIYVNPTLEQGTKFYVDNVNVKAILPGKGDPDTLTVFCIGNSLLNHGPNESLGWYGSWGMAASAADKDYYNVMQQLFKKDFPDVKNEWVRVGVAGFERAIDSGLDTDYTSIIVSSFGAKMREVVPDIVTFQMGDNTPASAITAESFAHALEQAIDFCRSVNPDVKIILSKNFYGGDAKVRGAAMAAANKGVALVDLSVYNKNEYKAIGQFEHSGVAGHPNDLGMQKVAETFYEVIKKYANGEEVTNELSSTVNGSTHKFTVEPVVENGKVFLPLKETVEQFGYLVYTDASYKALCVCLGNVSVIVPSSGEYAMTNTNLIKLSAPIKANGEDLIVPAELLEAVGVIVKYDALANVISIGK